MTQTQTGIVAWCFQHWDYLPNKYILQLNRWLPVILIYNLKHTTATQHLKIFKSAPVQGDYIQCVLIIFINQNWYMLINKDKGTFSWFFSSPPLSSSTQPVRLFSWCFLWSSKGLGQMPDCSPLFNNWNPLHIMNGNSFSTCEYINGLKHKHWMHSFWSLFSSVPLPVIHATFEKFWDIEALTFWRNTAPSSGSKSKSRKMPSLSRQHAMWSDYTVLYPKRQNISKPLLQKFQILRIQSCSAAIL
jgi:hypothetical protein